MCAYPAMDQYNDAVQNPKIAFSDSLLREAKFTTNSFGLPLAISGGFALTYTAKAQGKKYAVRCFRMEAKGVEARYKHVTMGLRAAGGSYFVGCDYLPAGILVNGGRYPIVKMDWVEGDTLGDFLEANHSNTKQIELLRRQFIDLE
ncbi:MAG: serine/threonine protein kinase, partial [Methylobacteriaceae bacterium]|nr:serine/threonine protein kinase [Methylobacteriaceae bacterium]